jgi:branched-chain amino acid transport system substrate-binding protein
VGLICTCSGGGGFGAFGVPGKDMYQAWVNTVNASGGINGHQVKLTVMDDTGNPGTALSDAQSLISSGVVALADLSLVDEPYYSTVQQAGVPVVGISIDSQGFFTNPDFYPEGQTQDSAIQSVITTAKSAGATNIANVYCAESPICAQSVPAYRAAGQKFGIPVTYNAEISATAPNYTAQCVAAKQQKVSSVFVGDAGLIIARFASDCATQGYKPIYLTEGDGFSTVESNTNGLKDNMWSPFPAIPFFDNTPAVQEANAAIDKYFPGVRTNPDLWLQNNFMAWISGKLLEAGIKAGGLTPTDTPSASEVVKGLNTLKGETLGGLTVPLTFTAGQPHPVDCWFTAKVQGGVPSTVNNGQVTCANGSSS